MTNQRYATLWVLVAITLLMGLSLLTAPAPRVQAGMPPAAPTPQDFMFKGGIRVSDGATRFIVDANGTAYIKDGSAAAPVITFWDDEDTGIYRKGTNNIGLATNGAVVFDCTASAYTNAGSLDQSNQLITNIGAAGTDFTSGGGLTTAGALQVNNNAAITGTLALGSNAATFSGPIKYGVASNYTSGTAITHGFTVTPTVCGMLGSSVAVTPTVFISATTTFSMTWDTGYTAYKMYWMCAQ